jgi:hypothetical protein
VAVVVAVVVFTAPSLAVIEAVRNLSISALS